MKLSAEELEKIKQRALLAKSKKDEENDEENDDEGDDQKFIDKANQNRNDLYENLENDLATTTKKLKSVRPVNTELRSLDNEIGGLEEDYEAIAKATEKDKDIWESRTENIAAGAEAAEEQNEEENESFIHMVKTGMYRGKRKKRKRSMGQVDLSESTENEQQNHAERIKAERMSKKGDERGL